MLDFVADTVAFVAGFGDKSAITWIRQLVAVNIVANSVDFVASTVDSVARMKVLSKSTFDKVDRVALNFVTSMYWASVIVLSDVRLI